MKCTFVKNVCSGHCMWEAHPNTSVFFFPARGDGAPHGCQGGPGRCGSISAQERSQSGDQVEGQTTVHSSVKAFLWARSNNYKTPPASLQDDQTALHISSRLGKVDIVQQLLQCGASANAATTSGYTPLHLAAREGHQDVAAMLLENGASLSSSTKVPFIEGFIWVPCTSTSGRQSLSLRFTRDKFCQTISSLYL